jgi:50S ribosomal protein L16 3-hydroxylase
MKSVLGSISPQQFLNEYWQKKPLLIRAAWPGFVSPISPDELAGLACEDDVESRLVVERGFEKPWQVVYGPLDPADFPTLPKTHWTLLVTDAEKHLPEMAKIVDQFRFIPDWRADDLMVSYAPQGGSVGPHWDTYDVFLLQGLGRRRWQISDLNVSEQNYLDGPDLRIMEHFEPQQDWILEPGDMLYLPPHIAHHGVAQDDCMTFSIGFRAPTIADMLSSYSDSRIEGLTESNRYVDPDLRLQDHPGEIGAKALADIQTMLLKQFQQSPAEFSKWFGSYSTAPKNDLRFPAEQSIDGFSEWRKRFEQSGGFTKSTVSRFSFVRSDAGARASSSSGFASLFVDGDCYEVSLLFAQWLCGERELSTLPVSADQLSGAETALLLELYNLGCIYFCDEISD